MGKISLGVLLLVVGCTYQTIDDVQETECSEMGCKIGLERVTQLADETSSAVAIATLFNRNGAQCIALGSADQTGGVRIVPRASISTSQVPIFVTARAPYIGEIAGPVDIYPIVGQANVQPQFDLIAFEQIPPFRPERAAMTQAYAGTLAAGVAQTFYFRVTGRMRISATSGGPSDLVTVFGAARRGANGTTGYNVPFIAKTVSASARAYAEWSTVAEQNGTTIPGESVIDLVSINLTSAAGGAFTCDVQAWD